ncbi:MAG: cell division protein FtsZ [SAR86 cluster bacterium]|uniref:Cell division protein FtsZ n=1 Tax=SAR86 cluster bacterium TaxID=2030880 RepID=A0A937I7N9_9GAMM|nr:cell division protein FtsZ [SAR86 cluster bacterium]
MTWQILEANYEQAKIAVIGIGGGGGNAIQHMINSGIQGVEFICANTDSQALSMVNNAKTIKLGNNLTKGLGAGNNPEIGKQATELSREDIIDHLSNTEMLFIAAGMGGGTGTGGAPVIAKIAKELNILTVAVVTTPFKTEGEKRANQAKLGISSLIESVDSLIEVDNERVFDIFPPETPIEKAFNEVNDVLMNAVKGVANIVLKPSKINVDFADVLSVMSQQGMALMGYGSASGNERASKAISKALNNPFFDRKEVKNAKGLLVNVCASSSITQKELKDILEEASSIGQDGVEAIPGLTIDESFGDSISVIIIATGLRRFNLGDFQRPKVFSTTSNMENIKSEYIDLDLINKADLKATLGRLKN